jgi:hypothetical protein
MDESKTPEERSDSQKSSGWPFSKDLTEAWEQLEERTRRRPGPTSFSGAPPRIPSAGYSISQPSHANRKALPDTSATRGLYGLRFAAGKICD